MASQREVHSADDAPSDDALSNTVPSGDALSERDSAILDFEAVWPRHSEAKEESIRSVFSVSAARYYQLLNAVIDSPAAVRHDPMLIRRLQRARDARSEARAGRAFTSSRHGSQENPPHRID